ncbi:MAG: hypothetical protein HKP01_12465 [Gemmatimonadetes bacterium]|nr:hypothetical protein [Gemmatimonadota bacterium]
MIISHAHRFIFIKTEKTAGTSIEIALSKYCGPDDVITTIVPEDEAVRTDLGYRGPQHYHVPLSRYTALDYLRALRHRRRLRFRNHSSAQFIQRYIDPAVWDSYYKFTFERNPWDKVISYYFWWYRDDDSLSLSEFIASGEMGRMRGFDLYSENSVPVVDDVFLFENLGPSMEELGRRLDLGETPELPRTKHGFRRDKRPYQEVLSAEDRSRIERVFAREIAYFGYRWD